MLRRVLLNVQILWWQAQVGTSNPMGRVQMVLLPPAQPWEVLPQELKASVRPVQKVLKASAHPKSEPAGHPKSEPAGQIPLTLPLKASSPAYLMVPAVPAERVASLHPSPELAAC
jgi:hypothetical protein